MLTIAVTGGIGSGKSTLSGILAGLGAVVVDSDRLARQVLEPGTPGLAAVTEQFGTGVLAGDGSLDRAALARIVFADAAARERLEQITHPLVRQAFGRARDAAGPHAIVVNDIPLVRAVPEAAAFHLVVTVTVGEEIRLRRLVARGLSEDDARARMRAQIADDRRRVLSDVMIDNSAGRPQLQRQAEQLWSNRLVPFERNIAAGERAARSAVRLVQHRDDWPTQARLLGARISAAAGGYECEHVGSTAVPGLAAKDVIDLQLAVPDPVTAQGLGQRLTAAGFPPVPGIEGDHPHPPGADPSGWVKRLHANADPCRAVNLHLRVRGAPNWRQALLFRDWLLADHAARSDYLALKQELADRHAGTRTLESYAEAKEPWWALAAPRAEAWAGATGWSPGNGPAV